jgi:dTDP-4-amino-4,6-dideoxygalactose transaminase
LRDYLGCEYAALHTNGHLALENLIEAFGLKGEIITTPFTFASTTHAIVRCGCTPVFADIDPVSFTLDPKKIEEKITEKTAAILPVHVYGNLCNVDAIAAIGKKHGIPVIYDAAHAFGVFRDGVSAAAFGDGAMFSFHATKVFHSIEGGLAVCRDGETLLRLNDLKNFGIHGPEEVPYVGGNAKMNEFCAAMGLCNLRHLEEEIEKRRRVVARYRARLEGVPGLQLNPIQEGVRSNNAYFPVVFDGFRLDRDQVFARLAENGVNTRKYFYPLTNSFECYADLPTAGTEKTPVAAYLADRVLTLPLYADLALEDVDRICGIILSCRK